MIGKRIARLRGFAPSTEGGLLAAIVVLLASAILAAFLVPADHRFDASREGGTLIAPPSDERFADEFGSPASPTAPIPALIGRTGSGDEGGGSDGSPGSPRAPGPTSPPPPPPEDPNSPEGLLDRLLEWPPPLRGKAPPGKAFR